MNISMAMPHGVMAGEEENCRSRRKKPKNVVDEEEASLNESESDDLDYLCDPNADLPFD